MSILKVLETIFFGPATPSGGDWPHRRTRWRPHPFIREPSVLGNCGSNRGVTLLRLIDGRNASPRHSLFRPDPLTDDCVTAAGQNPHGLAIEADRFLTPHRRTSRSSRSQTVLSETMVCETDIGGCGGMQHTIPDGSFPSSFLIKIASVPSTWIFSGCGARVAFTTMRRINERTSATASRSPFLPLASAL